MPSIFVRGGVCVCCCYAAGIAFAAGQGDEAALAAGRAKQKRLEEKADRRMQVRCCC